MSRLNEYKSLCKSIIVKDLKEIFLMFNRTINSNSNAWNEIKLIEYRHSAILRKKRLGTSDESTINIEMNNCVESLLHIIDLIEIKDVNLSGPNSNTSVSKATCSACGGSGKIKIYEDSVFGKLEKLINCKICKNEK